MGDPWTALGVLGALLALTVLFIHEPASVWAGNVAEFHFRFGSFLWFGVAAVLVGVVTMFLVLAALPANRDGSLHRELPPSASSGGSTASSSSAA